MSAIYLVNKDSYCVIERRSRIELDGDTFRPYPHAPSSQKKSTRYCQYKICQSTFNPWLQQRFDFDSTGIRRPFDFISKVIKVTVT